ncbi:MAG: GNAT family N-acetyltransferase [Velocimicrobium sp.]
MLRNVMNVATVIEYIEEHLSDKLDLDIVANAVHYSKYHLHRIFTETVGLTIHDYVQRRRLTEAAKLLIFSAKPIIEIAFIAGYESQQSFTTIFKEMYKKSPNQYRVNEIFYPLQLRYTLNKEATKIETDIDWKADIEFATLVDISEWMKLVRLVIDAFPYLKEDEYEQSLKQYIQNGHALIIKDKGTAIGIMAFNAKTGSIDFLGVHPQYRKKGIASAFLQKAMSELVKDDEISLTTFRSGDKADLGYRKIFKSLGFSEAELLVEFGYPTQRFILKKREWEQENYE